MVIPHFRYKPIRRREHDTESASGTTAKDLLRCRQLGADGEVHKAGANLGKRYWVATRPLNLVDTA
jgi:hypothetical protein